LALIVIALVATTLAEARALSFPVRHRSSTAVYLEGGESAGLSVGDRLEVRRDGEAIGELEVTFVAGFSASCRVIAESRPIAAGDRATITGLASEMLATVGAGEAALSPSTSAARAQEPAELSYQPSVRPTRPPTRVSGVIGVELESFSDDTGNDLDYERTQARLSLRGRDLGGLPISLRVRTRVQEIDRARELSGGVPADESRDRLYEVSVRYDAPSGRYSLMGGRLGAGPFISIGYLDGLLAEVRAFKAVSVGGFYGNRPDVDELGFDSFGAKYGAYLRFDNELSAGPRRFDVMLGGVREEGDLDVSREYALLETYYQASGVWSFFQRAEIDFNNEWREELSEDASQLSNLALAARARLSESVRLVISYDQFLQYRTEETRFVPEELFDDLLRQGLRVGLAIGRPQRLNWSLSAGWRDREDAEDSAVSLLVGAGHPDIGGGVSLGGEVMGYSNLYTEGAVVRLRGAKRLGGGHEFYLDLGTRFEEGRIQSDDETTDAWGRLGLWAELPARFFARGEVEYAAGDSLEGTRFILGLGYRF
jgi:hypothetical protein